MDKAKIGTTSSNIKKNSYIYGILLSLIIGFSIYFYGGSISGDDTFIYMRYVNNVNKGNGFCYNLQEKSFGTTSILWPLFMLPITEIFGNKIEIWKLTACFFGVLKAIILFLFFSSLNLNIIKSSFLTFFSFLEPHSFRWLSSGMENSISIFFLTLTAIIYYKCNQSEVQSKIYYYVLGLVIGIIPFLRPEFALFSIGIIIYYIFNLRSKIVIILIPAFLTVLFFTALTYLLTGFLIPQTAEAKAIGLFNGHIYAFKQTLKIIISGTLGSAILLFLLRNKKLKSSSWNLITIISLVSSIIYLVKIGQLVSTRYATFLCSPIILASTFSIAELLKIEINNKIKSSILIQIFIFIFFLIYLFPSTRLNEEKDIRIMAEYSVNNLKNNSRIALTEIGAYGYYTDFYIIDMIGLVDTSSLNWIKKYGRPRNIQELEKFLIFRNATHYIDCFSEQVELKGKNINFTLLKTVKVVRNNLSTGVPLESFWRLYSISVKNQLSN